LIKAIDLTKRYGKHEAVKEINFEIAKGEIIGVGLLCKPGGLYFYGCISINFGNPVHHRQYIFHEFQLCFLFGGIDFYFPFGGAPFNHEDLQRGKKTKD